MQCFKHLLILSGLSLIYFPASYAQENFNIETDFKECMGIDNASLRFSCYETLATKVNQSRLDSTENILPSSTDLNSTDTTTHESMISSVSTNPPTSSSTNSSKKEEPDSELDSFGRLETSTIPTGTSEYQTLESFEGNNARITQRDDGKKELQGVITQITYKSSEIQEVTIEGGQVWRQTIPKRYNLKVGAQIKIYPSGWGTAFRLQMEGRGGYIQVKRVK